MNGNPIDGAPQGAPPPETKAQGAADEAKHYCCAHSCPGLPWRASEFRHPCGTIKQEVAPECASERIARQDATTDELRAYFSGMGQRIADLEFALACKEDAIKTAIDALTRICEMIGAPAPSRPGDAVEAVKGLFGERTGLAGLVDS